MTSRKPKLNLLYVDAEACWLQPRLQLAVVTPDRSAVARHARHWQSGRALREPVAPSLLKH